MNFAPYAPPPDEQRRPRPIFTSTPHPSSPVADGAPDAQNSILGWNSTPSLAKHPPNEAFRTPTYHQGGRTVDPTTATSYHSSYRDDPLAGSSVLGTSNQSLPEGNRQPESSGLHLGAEAYETRLGWRVDLLAAMCYCTPLAAILILAFETKNDFVRIHGYQSVLLAVPLVFLHFCLLASHFLQVVLFWVDLGLYAWLGYQAFFDAEVLDRKLLPIVGPIAEQWTLEE